VTKRIRFSVRSLLALVPLVAVTLYVLYLRPIAVAKAFGRDMQVAARSDFDSVSGKYFGGMLTDGASLECVLEARTWADILRCRQSFSVRMKRPMANNNNQHVVTVHVFSATPISVYDRAPAPYALISDAK
jgi:hypothetical protein